MKVVVEACVRVCVLFFVCFCFPHDRYGERLFFHGGRTEGEREQREQLGTQAGDIT